MDDKLVRLSDVERWILTESACIDTPADRDDVVDRMRYSIPAVYAVEVCRCADCVHFEPFRRHDGFCKIDGMLRENDFFCENGQRREDGDNT